MIGSSSFNPSTNTLPITGSALTLTSTGTQISLSYDSSHRATFTVDSAGRIIFDGLDAFSVRFKSAGTTLIAFEGNGVSNTHSFGFFFVDSAGYYEAIRPRYKLTGQGGLTDGGANDSLGLTANGTVEEFHLSTTLLSTLVPIKTLTTTVASLPSAATIGQRAFVTDASTTVILGLGLTVVGGGANKVPVYSDGTNWIVG